MSMNTNAQTKIRRALISVYDKTGMVDFARALHDEFGVEIISTGGTAKTLREAGIPVTLVEQITGFPEMLDGRVKTLHPKIHAAILADRDNPEHMRQLKEQGIEPIDMVVVDLYPFEKTTADPNCTFEQAIEMIDIGGPCLLRAAAKNHKHVWAVPFAGYREKLLGVLRSYDSESTAHLRASLAQWVFNTTRTYDAAIEFYLDEQSRRMYGLKRAEALAHETWLIGYKLSDFRYGENPHQRGAGYRIGTQPTDFEPIDVSSREQLSYNNVVDASAASDLCAELTRANPRQNVCCFIKHTNACGAAVGTDQLEVYRKAYLGDPNAAMGGILAVNFEVDAAFAETVMQTYAQWGKAAGAGGFFVEVWVAPSFEDGAVEVIRTRKEWGKRVRLLAVGDMSVAPDPGQMDFKRIAGGMLMQTRDLVGLNEEQWKVVTTRQPTESQMADLRLAWLICKHTKSNAITICRDGMLLGNGAGQMSRVMSCRIATWLAKENGHAEALKDAVAASDAFFPFRDGPDILIDAGVTALIQPGGSKNDQQVIDACDERNVGMIFTGTRHFRH
jgi:phosphoribosylaminoimidazolecarboxamide formyltransferase/IMP cyclohydrolase